MKEYSHHLNNIIAHVMRMPSSRTLPTCDNHQGSAMLLASWRQLRMDVHGLQDHHAVAHAQIKHCTICSRAAASRPLCMCTARQAPSQSMRSARTEKRGSFSKDQLTWRAHVRRHSPLGKTDILFPKGEPTRSTIPFTLNGEIN